MNVVGLFERAGEQTTKIVEQVGPGQLGDATPCADWDVRALLNHLIGGNYMFATLAAGKELPDMSGGMPDMVGDDPAAAYRTSYEAAVQAWRQPDVMDKVLPLPFGPMPGSQAVGMHFMDTLVHGWDVAKATGQDTSLDPELAGACLAMMRDALGHGRPPVFGPEVPVASDAPAGHQLVGLLGRNP